LGFLERKSVIGWGHEAWFEKKREGGLGNRINLMERREGCLLSWGVSELRGSYHQPYIRRDGKGELL